MGKILSLKCDNCDYSEELRIGSGIKDNDPDMVSGYFPDDRREIIHKITAARTVWNYRRIPVLCRKCGRFTTVPLFEALGNDTLRVAGKCGCGHEIRTAVLIKPEEGIVNVSCPKCGKRVRSEMIGLWD